MDTDKVWLAVLESLRLNLSEATFNAYLRNTQLLEARESGDKLVCEIGCASSFIKNTIDLRYSGQIGEELGRITGKKCETVLVVKSKKREDPGFVSGTLFDQQVKPKEDGWKKANLRENYTFDTYAVGTSNQMAFAAAQAVAKRPGQSYNPLFIYGGVGVGKTHLMQAIGHEILQKDRGGILFCTGEEFTNDLVEAIRYKSTDKVRSKYRKLKLLMIDDVQFIAGKPSVQEEFFHTFNSIQREGGQVVMTSDKPPSEISKLEERLRSRFGAGLIVDIGPADFELRTAILLIKAKQKHMELSMENAQLIANSIEGVRELEGFLTRAYTETEVKGVPLDTNILEHMLNVPQNKDGAVRMVTPAEIINAVGNYYGVGMAQIKGDRRTKMVAWPRQIVMYLMRNELGLPLEEVGRLIGGRDHTTVMHASDKVKNQLDSNPKLRMEMGEIRKRIFSANINGG